MTLGARIRALRMQQNLSQEELAEKLDVSRQSVSPVQAVTVCCAPRAGGY